MDFRSEEVPPYGSDRGKRAKNKRSLRIVTDVNEHNCATIEERSRDMEATESDAPKAGEGRPSERGRKNILRLLSQRRSSLSVYNPHSVLFEAFIMMIIVANYTVLAISAQMMPTLSADPGAYFERVRNASWPNTNQAIGMGDVTLNGSTTHWSFLEFMYYFDYVITAVFAFELLCKVIALGFVMGKKSYLRDAWNRLDFIATVGMVLEKVLPFPNISILRLARVLRSIRMLQMFKNIAVILAALSASVSLLADLILFLLFFFVVVGLFAVTLFSDITDHTTAYLEWFGDENFTRFVSFENIGSATLTNFVSATLEGWTDVMYMMQSAGYEQAWIFFVVLVTIGNFLLFQLFVGVITSMYSRTRKMQDIVDSSMRLRNARHRGRDRVRTWKLRLSWMIASVDWQSVKEETDEDITERHRRRDKLNEAKEAPGSDAATPHPQLTTANGGRSEPNGNGPDSARDGSATATVKTVTIRTPREKSRARRFLDSVNSFVRHKAFEIAVLLAILLNTVILAIEHEGQSDQLTEIISASEVAFVVFFTCEMAVKLLGLGLRGYFGVNLNLFDFGLVCASLLEISLSEEFSGVNLSLFRVFRLVRVVRLTRVFFRAKSMRKLLQTAFKSIYSLLNLVLFILIILMATAVFGVQLYNGNYGWGAERIRPRVNFDNLFNGLVTLFIVMTGENWNQVLYNCMDAKWNSWIAIPFVVCWFLFSSYILLNLFVAVILENFDLSHEQKLEAQRRLVIKHLKRAHCREIWDSKSTTSSDAIYDTKSSEHITNENKMPPQDGTRSQEFFEIAVNSIPQRRDNLPMQSLVSVGGENIDDKTGPCSLETSQPRQKLREKVFAVIIKPWFDWMIIGVILVSAILLTVESPAMERDPAAQGLLRAFFWCNVGIILIFTGEAILKMIALGIKCGQKGTYFRDRWNVLDFIVLMIAYIELCIEIISYNSVVYSVESSESSAGVAGFGRILRLLRVFRPLRMISKNEGMKTIMKALGKALPSILNATMLMLGFYFIFAILGTNLFMGQLLRCNDPAFPPGESLHNCSGEYFDWILEQYVPRAVVDPGFSFDNVGESLLTLLDISTLEGWIDVMFVLQDIAGNNTQPIENNSVGNAAFVIIFIIFGVFFLLNIFVGVMVDSFNRSSGAALQTEQQQRWSDLMRLTAKTKPIEQVPPPRSSFLFFCYDICVNCRLSKEMCRSSRHHVHKHFDHFILAVIGVNVVALFLEHKNQPDWIGTLVGTINSISLGIFTVELLFKLCGMRPKRYFRHPWNVFDFVLVIGSLLLALINVTSPLQLPSLPQLIRVFRIGRLVRVLRTARGLRTIFKAFLVSLPALANISLLMLLVFFIYALVGVELLSLPVELQPLLNESDVLHEWANFEDFPHALGVLFRIATGENWPLIQRFYINELHYVWAPLYFLSFFMIGVHLFLNLYIAAVVDSFRFCFNTEAGTITPAHVRKYKKVWLKYDTHGRGEIPAFFLRRLLNELEYPLVSHPLSRHSFRTLYREAKEVRSDGLEIIRFDRLFHTLSLHCLGVESLELLQQQERLARIRSVVKDEAASLIVAAFKGKRERAELELALTDREDDYVKVLRARSLFQSTAQSAKTSVRIPINHLGTEGWEDEKRTLARTIRKVTTKVGHRAVQTPRRDSFDPQEEELQPLVAHVDSSHEDTTDRELDCNLIQENGESTGVMETEYSSPFKLPA